MADVKQSVVPIRVDAKASTLTRTTLFQQSELYSAEQRVKQAVDASWQASIRSKEQRIGSNVAQWLQQDYNTYRDNFYGLTINGLVPLSYDFSNAIAYIRGRFPYIPQPRYYTNAEILSMSASQVIQLYYGLRQYEYVADNPNLKYYSNCTRIIPTDASANIPLERHGVRLDYYSDYAREWTEIHLQQRIFALRKDLHQIYDPQSKQWIKGLIDLSNVNLRGICPKEGMDEIAETVVGVVFGALTAGLGTVVTVAKYAIQAAQLAMQLAKAMEAKKHAKQLENTVNSAVAGADAILQNQSSIDQDQAYLKELLFRQAVMEQACLSGGIFGIQYVYPETGVKGTMIVVHRDERTGKLNTIPVRQGAGSLDANSFLKFRGIGNNLPITIQKSNSVKLPLWSDHPAAYMKQFSANVAEYKPVPMRMGNSGTWIVPMCKPNAAQIYQEVSGSTNIDKSFFETCFPTKAIRIVPNDSNTIQQPVVPVERSFMLMQAFQSNLASKTQPVVYSKESETDFLFWVTLGLILL